MTRPHFELSFSRLGDLGCPYFYQARELRADERPDTFYAHVGTVAHAIVAEYGEWLCKVNVNRRIKNLGHIRTHPGKLDQIIDKYLTGEPEDVREAVMDAINSFTHQFAIEEHTEYIFERRYAVDRNFQPCAPDAECDRFAGTMDMVEIKESHGLVRITDYKMGYMRFGYDELVERPDGTLTKLGRQLMLYSALWMWTHPECDAVSVLALAPRYNSNSPHEWTRETCLPRAEKMVTEGFARLDRLWDAHGTADWPHEACANCIYCQIPCPAKCLDEIYKECA